MHTFILQDWTTIRGGVATVTQQETDWLDLEAFQDVVFWIEVKEATNAPTLALQTAPTMDDVFFQGMVAGQTMTASITPTVVSAFMSTAATPLARFVRWQITGTVTWDATFRIVVAANSPGL